MNNEVSLGHSVASTSHFPPMQQDRIVTSVAFVAVSKRKGLFLDCVAVGEVRSDRLAAEEVARQVGGQGGRRGAVLVGIGEGSAPPRVAA